MAVIWLKERFDVLRAIWVRLEQSLWARRLLALWGVVVGVAIVIHLANHVMWRDELQAYTIARDSHTLAALFYNISYEGFPALWFLVLKGIQFLSPDPEAMQILHGGLALLNIFLLARYAPMHPVVRMLLIVAYPFSFQFALTSRCYAIGITFLLGALVAKDRGKNLLYWILLGIAAQSTLLITALACMMGLERFLHSPRELWRERVGVGLFAVAILLALWIAMPNADRLTVQDIAAGRPFWFFMQAWLLGWQVPVALSGGLQASLVLLFYLLLSCPALNWKRSSILAWMAGIGAFFVVDRIGYPLSFYHLMLLPVGLVALVWQTKSLVKWHAVLAFLVLFSTLSFSGFKSLSYSQSVPYSQGKNVAMWIKEKGLQDAFWIGIPDYAATTVSGYLDRLFYFPQCDCMGAAPHWSKRNKRTLSFEDTLKQAESVMTQKNIHEAWLLLGTGEMQKEPSFIETVPRLRAYQTKSFLGAQVLDEQFFVYKLIRD